MSHSGSIGVFDSGVGGLTVLKALIHLLPREHLIYLGDTAHTPYGPRSSENIRALSVQNARFLFSQKIKMLVIACNTASARTGAHIRQMFPLLPVVDVIEPCVHRISECTSGLRIAVIGTQGTIASMVYESAIQSLDKGFTVYSKACSLFVPLVEEGIQDVDLKQHVIRYYLKEFKEQEIDVLILGCTHYPLLIEDIRAFWGGEPVQIFDSATWTAREVAVILKQADIEAPDNRHVDLDEHRFFVTDDVEKFKQVGSRFLGMTLKNVEKVEL